MKILKFGGTSVGSPERIRHVARLCLDSGRNVVVLSAMSGTTNSLVEIADYLYKGNVPGAQETINSLRQKYRGVVADLFDSEDDRSQVTELVEHRFNYISQFTEGEFTAAEEKEILACGELISTALMLLYMRAIGVRAVMLPALDYMRTLEGGEPDMKYITSHLRRLIDSEPDADIWITQGYICRNCHGEVDNLRRGGSDYSASLIGAALNADEIQIWTDIDGMHTGDPRYVNNTRPVSRLHFEEAAELAYFGAKILHPTCVLPAKLHNIPVRLLNTMQPEAQGTLIANFPPDGTIKAVAAKDPVTAIKIKSGRMLLAYGFLHKVFETFDNYNTAIDMMATSEVGVTVTIDNTEHLADIIDEIKTFGTVTVDPDMVIICVVGDLDWKNGKDYAARAVDALRELPVRMISYGGSNYNISMLVRAEDKIKALNLLNEKLF
ncbi:MAG: aspartate kinase [Muribaculaceae bacterium]|nr:aspartate kinase [Muribaculaceae bacterium]